LSANSVEEGRDVSVDRRAINVLLAALDIEQRELAQMMGYDPRYVVNVVNGFTLPSEAFKDAFGKALADLLLGQTRREAKAYPAGPLVALMRKRAAQAPCKADFYADLGVTGNGWGTRRSVPVDLVDRICCALGVHPSAVYPEYGNGHA
jgi:hypothetical protein